MSDNMSIATTMSNKYIEIAQEIPPAIGKIQITLDLLKEKIENLDKTCSNKETLKILTNINSRIESLWKYYSEGPVKLLVSDLSNMEKHDVVLALNIELKKLDNKLDKVLNNKQQEFEMKKVKWRGYLDLIIKLIAVVAAAVSMFYYNNRKFSIMHKQIENLHEEVVAIGRAEKSILKDVGNNK